MDKWRRTSNDDRLERSIRKDVIPPAAKPSRAASKKHSRFGWQWDSRPRWDSFLTSCVVHLLLLLTAASFWRPQSNGNGGLSDRPIGIAIVNESIPASSEQPPGDESGASGDVSENLNAAMSKALTSFKSSTKNGKTAEQLLVDDLLGDLNSVSSAAVQTSLGGAGNSATGFLGNGTSGSGSSSAGGGSGNGNGSGGKSQVSTTVFGIEGKGSSFVYVFDRSDSMNGHGGAPLRAAKRELAESLATLKSIHQFQIVFYNEAPTVYQGMLSANRRLVFAADNERRSAITYVKSMQGRGGTEHMPALRTGINMNADVIFFLTDAADPALSESQVYDLVERCTSRGTTIHSIEFGSGQSVGDGRWIEALAKRTGGRYRYVDVDQLRD